MIFRGSNLLRGPQEAQRDMIGSWYAPNGKGNFLSLSLSRWACQTDFLPPHKRIPLVHGALIWKWRSVGLRFRNFWKYCQIFDAAGGKGTFFSVWAMGRSWGLRYTIPRFQSFFDERDIDLDRYSVFWIIIIVIMHLLEMWEVRFMKGMEELRLSIVDRILVNDVIIFFKESNL